MYGDSRIVMINCVIHGEVDNVADSSCLSPIKPRDRLGDVVDGPMKSGSAKRREQEGTPTVIGQYVVCLHLFMCA